MNASFGKYINFNFKIFRFYIKKKYSSRFMSKYIVFWNILLLNWNNESKYLINFVPYCYPMLMCNSLTTLCVAKKVKYFKNLFKYWTKKKQQCKHILTMYFKCIQNKYLINVHILALNFKSVTFQGKEIASFILNKKRRCSTKKRLMFFVIFKLVYNRNYEMLTNIIIV